MEEKEEKEYKNIDKKDIIPQLKEKDDISLIKDHNKKEKPKKKNKNEININEEMKGFLIFTDKHREKNCIRDAYNILNDVIEKLYPILEINKGNINLNEEININNTNKNLTNYFHNLKVINNMDIKENKEFQKILNMKFYELFNEYLNSVEFQIDEINRLKKKKFENSFINRYISISKNFIDFFSK